MNLLFNYTVHCFKNSRLSSKFCVSCATSKNSNKSIEKGGEMGLYSVAKVLV